MSAVAAVLLALALLVVCSLRPVDADARTPAQLTATVRQAGWVRGTARVLWAVAVVSLLTLGAVGVLAARAVYTAAAVAALLGGALDLIVAGPQEVAQ
jgi:hypothetical protein